MSALSESIRDIGYAVAEGVLTPDEVIRARLTVHEVLDERGKAVAGGTVLPNAAVGAPELSWLFGHPNMVGLARDALATDDIMFTFEADLHRNYLASAWHKDTGEGHMAGGYFGLDPLRRPDCLIVKLAVYLQDHAAGEGIHVRRGSQTVPSVDVGDDTELRPRPGDVVLFDVRITHRGVRPSTVDQVIRAYSRYAPKPIRPPSADALRRRWLAARHHEDRLAVYFAFGLANENSRVFASRNMSRQLQSLRSQSKVLPSALVDSFERAGVMIPSL